LKSIDEPHLDEPPVAPDLCASFFGPHSCRASIERVGHFSDRRR
jgi:hypothetical protein